jgi:hypothetical protein
VHLIAALALHRRMTEAELRHAVGDRVYDAFAPDGLLYNHDAEDPDNLAFLGTTEKGEEVEINKRAAESDLVVYVNINLVSMDGGHKSTATGLSSYRSLRHHHNVHTMQHSKSFMDRTLRAALTPTGAMGKVLRDAGVKVFQIETTVNNDVFGDGPLLGAGRSASGSGPPATGRCSSGCRQGLKRHVEPPAPLARSSSRGRPPRHDLGAGRRGRGRARAHDPARLRQHLVPVEGQTDILTMGLPYICPYNVNSIMNPILVMCLGLGYFFNLYRGKPLVREGGVLIMSHPTPWSSTRCTTRATSTSSSRCWPRPPTRSRSSSASRRTSPRTSGTATCTGRATPTTASTRSTCGTGAATPCSTSAR